MKVALGVAFVIAWIMVIHVIWLLPFVPKHQTATLMKYIAIVVLVLLSVVMLI
jgi:hypothetical protein